MPTDDRTRENDILGALMLGAQGGNNTGIDWAQIIEAIHAMGEPKKKLSERSLNVDMTPEGDFLDQFRNEGYPPRSSNVPYIFTGGSPFPQTEGQQRAEKVAAIGGASANMLDAMNPTIAAIVDTIRRRRGGRS